jgi:hypothetical protein
MFDGIELSQKLYYESDSLRFLNHRKAVRNPPYMLDDKLKPLN